MQAAIPERLHFTYCHSITVQGGFFFHPIEQKSLAGDPGKEKSTQLLGFC
jgi:hypothetical protein